MSAGITNLCGVEESAVKIITRAIQLEQEKKFQPSLTCYQEGIDLLLDVLKGSMDTQKKIVLRKKLEEYMTRAEKIKAVIAKQKEEGKYHTQIHVQEGDTGYSYTTVFSPYLGENVNEIWIEDPYIRSHHQICNLLRFFELVVLKCENIKTINLKTSTDVSNKHDQSASLLNIKEDLKKRNIQLFFTFEESLHDREIRLNNGWIIKIGRGLDYFKRANKFSLGFFNFDLRQCHQTTIDVYHSSKTKT